MTYTHSIREKDKKERLRQLRKLTKKPKQSATQPFNHRRLIRHAKITSLTYATRH